MFAINESGNYMWFQDVEPRAYESILLLVEDELGSETITINVL